SQVEVSGEDDGTVTQAGDPGVQLFSLFVSLPGFSRFNISRRVGALRPAEVRVNYQRALVSDGHVDGNRAFVDVGAAVKTDEALAEFAAVGCINREHRRA